MQFLIIGSSAAGWYAAVTLASQKRSDFSVTCLSRDYSCVPYNRCRLMSYLAGHVSKEKLFLTSDPVAHGVTMVSAELIAVDVEKRCVITSSGDTYSYDRLLIATGATPIIPEPFIQHWGDPGLLTCYTMDDVDDIKNDIMKRNRPVFAIIGGGVMGVELIDALRNLDVSLYLIEAGSTLLSRIGNVFISDYLAACLDLYGVMVYTGTKVQQVEKNSDAAFLLTLSNGRVLIVDTVILCVGVKPASTFLSQTDIVRNGNGAIVVNDMMQTSNKYVYAAGDVAVMNVFDSDQSYNWARAVQQGIIAARAMSDTSIAHTVAVRPMIVSSVFDQHIVVWHHKVPSNSLMTDESPLIRCFHAPSGQYTITSVMGDRDNVDRYSRFMYQKLK